MISLEKKKKVNVSPSISLSLSRINFDLDTKGRRSGGEAETERAQTLVNALSLTES